LFRLAAHTSYAVKHWPEPRDWLALAQDWGLDAVQFSFDLLDPMMTGAAEIATEIRGHAGKAGIELVSTFTGGQAYQSNMLLHPDPRYRAWARDWWVRAVELTARLGAPATGGHFGALPAKLASPDQARLTGSLVDAATEIGDAALTHGLEYLLLELMPGPGELPNSPEGAVELLERLNERSPVPYCLCFDLGHACSPAARSLGPEAVYGWLERCLPWTRCVHLQQTDGIGDRHWPFGPRYDAGAIIRPREVLSILRDSPLPVVDLVLELGHSPEVGADEVAADWRMSAEVWREAIAQTGAGLEV